LTIEKYSFEHIYYLRSWKHRRTTAYVNMTRRYIDNALEGLYPDERLDSIGRDTATPTVAARPVDLAT